MEFPNIPKMCPKCGREIQTNGWELDENGKVKLDAQGHAHYKPALLICEHCAIAAMPPKPKKRRRLRGEIDVDQMTIDAPPIKI